MIHVVLRRAGLLVMIGGALACADSARGPGTEQVALGGDVVARVGTETISVALVAHVAADQGISPQETLQHLINNNLQ